MIIPKESLSIDLPDEGSARQVANGVLCRMPLPPVEPMWL